MFQLKRKIKIQWSPDFAYAVGLITSDGCLHKDGRHLSFVSAEMEMINNFRNALLLKNQIGQGLNGRKTSHYFYISFGDKNFYNFLNSIGLTHSKSKTIKQLKIPKRYFADFLRGLFDGDGSFWTFWDKRWPNSFGYKVTFASASLEFLTWLKTKLTSLYDIKGHIKQGKGVYEIRYVKGDSNKLFRIMYYKPRLLFLKRKYDKIKNAIEFDASLKTAIA